MRVCVSAVDASANHWAASVVRKLAGEGVGLFGLGGDALAKAGLHVTVPAGGLSAVGITEAVPKLVRGARALSRLGSQLSPSEVDALLVVDSPSLHVPLTRLARRRTVPVVYYLPPQAWAWRSCRARHLRGDVQLAVSLPFEAAWWRQRGVNAEFVGHPILDETPLARRPESGVCAVLPGSRRREIERHLGPMLAAARRVGFHPVVGLGPNVRVPAGLEVTSHRRALSRCEVALAKCGTVALEAALVGVPTVIVYRLSALSYALARRWVRVPFVGLPNLVLGRQEYPELLQTDVTASAMGSAIETIVGRDHVGIAAELRSKLGSPGAAQRVAELLLARGQRVAGSSPLGRRTATVLRAVRVSPNSTKVES